MVEFYAFPHIRIYTIVHTGNSKKKSTPDDKLDGDEESLEDRSGLAPYDLPYVKGYLRRQKWTRFVPILPYTRKL